jgi:hypothetical protein
MCQLFCVKSFCLVSHTHSDCVQGFITDHERALEELFCESAEGFNKYNACLNTMATRISTVFASMRVCIYLLHAKASVLLTWSLCYEDWYKSGTTALPHLRWLPKTRDATGVGNLLSCRTNIIYFKVKSARPFRFAHHSGFGLAVASKARP